MDADPLVNFAGPGSLVSELYYTVCVCVCVCACVRACIMCWVDILSE